MQGLTPTSFSSLPWAGAEAGAKASTGTGTSTGTEAGTGTSTGTEAGYNSYVQDHASNCTYYIFCK